MTKQFGLGIEHEVLLLKEVENGNNIVGNISYITQFHLRKYPNDRYSQRASPLTEPEFYNQNEEKIGNLENDISLENITEFATGEYKNKTVEKASDMIRTITREAMRGSDTVQYPLPYINNRRDITASGNTLNKSGETTAGSYHVTISLPHEQPPHQNEREFVKMMRNFAKRLQWFEPLILSCYGGGNHKSVGDGSDNRLSSEGSHRQIEHWGLIGSSKTTQLVEDSTYGRHVIERDTVPDIKYNPNIKYNATNTEYTRVGSDLRWGDREGRFGTQRFGLGEGKDNGIEIRFLDSFSDVAIDDVIKTFIYIAENGQNDVDDPLASTSQSWNEATNRIFFEGWNTYLPQSYINDLRRLSQLPIQTFSQRAEDILRQVTYELWYYHRKGEIPQLMIENNQTPPEVYNFSREVWNHFFKIKLQEEPNIYSKIKDLIQEEETFDSFKQNLKNTVDSNTQLTFSVEDTRDILDFLEYWGYINIIRNSDGSIHKYQKTDKNLNDLDSFIYQNNINKDYYTSYENADNKDETLRKLYKFTHTDENISSGQMTEKQIHVYTKAIVDVLKNQDRTVPQLYNMLSNNYPDIAKHNIRYILNEKLSPDYVIRNGRNGRAIIWTLIQTPPAEMMGLNTGQRTSIRPNNENGFLSFFEENKNYPYTIEELSNYHGLSMNQIETKCNQMFLNGELYLIYKILNENNQIDQMQKKYQYPDSDNLNLDTMEFCFVKHDLSDESNFLMIPFTVDEKIPMPINTMSQIRTILQIIIYFKSHSGTGYGVQNLRESSIDFDNLDNVHITLILDNLKHCDILTNTGNVYWFNEQILNPNQNNENYMDLFENNQNNIYTINDIAEYYNLTSDEIEQICDSFFMDGRLILIYKVSDDNNLIKFYTYNGGNIPYNQISGFYIYCFERLFSNTGVNFVTSINENTTILPYTDKGIVEILPRIVLVLKQNYPAYQSADRIFSQINDMLSTPYPSVDLEDCKYLLRTLDDMGIVIMGESMYGHNVYKINDETIEENIHGTVYTQPYEPDEDEYEPDEERGYISHSDASYPEYLYEYVDEFIRDFEYHISIQDLKNEVIQLADEQGEEMDEPNNIDMFDTLRVLYSEGEIIFIDGYIPQDLSVEEVPYIIRNDMDIQNTPQIIFRELIETDPHMFHYMYRMENEDEYYIDLSWFDDLNDMSSSNRFVQWGINDGSNVNDELYDEDDEDWEDEEPEPIEITPETIYQIIEQHNEGHHMPDDILIDEIRATLNMNEEYRFTDSRMGEVRESLYKLFLQNKILFINGFIYPKEINGEIEYITDAFLQPKIKLNINSIIHEPDFILNMDSVDNEYVLMCRGINTTNNSEMIYMLTNSNPSWERIHISNLKEIAEKNPNVSPITLNSEIINLTAEEDINHPTDNNIFTPDKRNEPNSLNLAQNFSKNFNPTGSIPHDEQPDIEFEYEIEGEEIREVNGMIQHRHPAHMYWHPRDRLHREEKEKLRSIFEDMDKIDLYFILNGEYPDTKPQTSKEELRTQIFADISSMFSDNLTRDDLYERLEDLGVFL